MYKRSPISMTPMQSIRLWSRRAPTAERIAAATAFGTAVAVLVWLGGSALSASGTTATADVPDQLSAGGTTASSQSALVGGPASSVADASSGGQQVAGTGPGPAMAGAPGAGTASAPPGSDSPGSAAHAAAQPGAVTCPAAPDQGHGVTTRRIKLGVMLVAVAGAAANSTFGVASVSEQKGYANAVVDDLNSHGGVACRKIVIQFFQGNPADESDLQQKCLDVVQADVFALIDIGAYSVSNSKSCFGRNRIPYFGGYLIAESLRAKFYPYLFELGSYDRTYRDAVAGLTKAGFFSPSKGFKKLGLIYRSCFPEVVQHLQGWLHQAGVPAGNIVTYDVGCPQALANPGDIQQAVLTFRQAGVTSVTTAFFTGDFSNFSKFAEQQGYRPKYGLADDQLITVSYGSLHPDYNNINGAIAISLARSAEETTPGMRPTAGTLRCDAIFAKHGLEPTYKQPYAAGNACDQAWMFAAAVTHAPALRADALAAGLQRAKTIEFSFPQGPNNFAIRGGTTGGQFWRSTAFTTSCNCWRVTDPTFRPTTF